MTIGVVRRDHREESEPCSHLCKLFQLVKEVFDVLSIEGTVCLKPAQESRDRVQEKMVVIPQLAETVVNRTLLELIVNDRGEWFLALVAYGTLPQIWDDHQEILRLVSLDEVIAEMNALIAFKMRRLGEEVSRREAQLSLNKQALTRLAQINAVLNQYQ